jgi:hypothetical protein
MAQNGDRSMHTKRIAPLLALVCALPLIRIARMESGPQSPIGKFEGHQDIGKVLRAGSVDYNASAKTYTLAAARMRHP